MAPPEPFHHEPSETTSQQINDLFDAVELTHAIESEEFKHFLDHIPIAIVVSKFIRGDQRICYANKAFETLAARTLSDLLGRGWSVLAEFREESNSHLTLDQAMLKGGEDFLGTFRREQPKPIVVEAYCGLIENEDGTENYRIAALIDVTERARAEREEFARQLREKDTLLKELQHRVKNNLQLLTALIRLDARNQSNGNKVNLERLAGRIEALQILYQTLSTDGWGHAVDLAHYLSQISSAVMHAYAVDGIRLHLDVEHAPVSINVAMPIGLLVNELLTNAFKHAFSETGKGTITIECRREAPDKYRIVVCDDGAGLPAGATWPVPGKLGALIVQTLRENTKTDFNVETAPGKGTRVTVSFVHNAPAPTAS